MRWSAVGAPPLATPVSKHAVQLGGIRGLELTPILLADHARHLFSELLDPAPTAAGAESGEPVGTASATQSEALALYVFFLDSTPRRRIPLGSALPMPVPCPALSTHRSCDRHMR